MGRFKLNCTHCGSKFDGDILQYENGIPFFLCPECGCVQENNSWFKYVSEDKAREIIETREPIGCFVLDSGIEIIGIDNRTGDAWTEEFPDLLECVYWLLDIGMER